MTCMWSSWCHCHPIISASENPGWFILLVPAYLGFSGKKPLDDCFCCCCCCCCSFVGLCVCRYLWLCQGSYWPGKWGKSLGILPAFGENFVYHLCFYSAVALFVTFFNLSLIVACLGKSTLRRSRLNLSNIITVVACKMCHRIILHIL